VLLASIICIAFAAFETRGALLSFTSLTFIITLLGAEVLVIRWGVRRKNKARRSMSGRFRRLEALLAHPEGVSRFPHRATEYYLQQHPYVSNGKGVREMMKRCPPGTAILCNVPSPTKLPPPRAHEIAFEPILRDQNGCLQLLSMGYDGSIPENLRGTVLRAKNSGEAWRTIRRRFPSLLIEYTVIIFICLFIATLILVTITAIGQGNWDQLRVTLPLLLILAISGAIASFLEKKVWGVPRGFFLAPDSALMDRTKFTLCTRDSHRLLYLPVRPRMVILVSSEKIDATVRASLPELYAILTAWLSEARPPTQDEIRSFLEGRQ
jgi:hypothetical protein